MEEKDMNKGRGRKDDEGGKVGKGGIVWRIREGGG